MTFFYFCESTETSGVEKLFPGKKQVTFIFLYTEADARTNPIMP